MRSGRAAEVRREVQISVTLTDRLAGAVRSATPSSGAPAGAATLPSLALLPPPPPSWGLGPWRRQQPAPRPGQQRPAAVTTSSAHLTGLTRRLATAPATVPGRQPAPLLGPTAIRAARLKALVPPDGRSCFMRSGTHPTSDAVLSSPASVVGPGGLPTAPSSPAWASAPAALPAALPASSGEASSTHGTTGVAGFPDWTGEVGYSTVVYSWRLVRTSAPSGPMPWLMVSHYGRRMRWLSPAARTCP